MIAMENQFTIEEAHVLHRSTVGATAPGRGVGVEILDAADIAFDRLANTERFPVVARQGCGE